MIHITITATVVGSSYIWSLPDKKGRRRRVPTYRTTVHSTCSPATAEFTVTRDTALSFFPLTYALHPYGPDRECPPNPADSPYIGALHSWKKISFGVRLYQPGHGNEVTLCSPDGWKRIGIVIHEHLGYSEGCFMIAGGQSRFIAFKQVITSLAAQERDPSQPEIRVHVKPR